MATSQTKASLPSQPEEDKFRIFDLGAEGDVYESVIDDLEAIAPEHQKDYQAHEKKTAEFEIDRRYAANNAEALAKLDEQQAKEEAEFEQKTRKKKLIGTGIASVLQYALRNKISPDTSIPKMWLESFDKQKEELEGKQKEKKTDLMELMNIRMADEQVGMQRQQFAEGREDRATTAADKAAEESARTSLGDSYVSALGEYLPEEARPFLRLHPEEAQNIISTTMTPDTLKKANQKWDMDVKVAQQALDTSAMEYQNMLEDKEDKKSFAQLALGLIKSDQATPNAQIMYKQWLSDNQSAILDLQQKQKSLEFTGLQIDQSRQELGGGGAGGPDQFTDYNSGAQWKTKSFEADNVSRILQNPAEFNMNMGLSLANKKTPAQMLSGVNHYMIVASSDPSLNRTEDDMRAEALLRIQYTDPENALYYTINSPEVIAEVDNMVKKGEWQKLGDIYKKPNSYIDNYFKLSMPQRIAWIQQSGMNALGQGQGGAPPPPPNDGSGMPQINPNAFTPLQKSKAKQTEESANTLVKTEANEFLNPKTMKAYGWNENSVLEQVSTPEGIAELKSIIVKADGSPFDDVTFNKIIEEIKRVATNRMRNLESAFTG